MSISAANPSQVRKSVRFSTCRPSKCKSPNTGRNAKFARIAAARMTAGFPADVCAPTQYGPGMQAVMSYLNVRQVVPCARTAEICQDLFGHRPSAGSVVQAVTRCAGKTRPRRRTRFATF